MKSSLAQTAVDQAIKGLWEEAVKTNLLLIEDNNQDTEALNRLARAYAELGNISKAKHYTNEVLKIEPDNPIATKCLAKWKGLTEGEKATTSLTSQAFIEDPGKTKLVSLINLGDLSVIGQVNTGELAKIDCHPHRVSVVTEKGKYIGRLPDDMASRLGKLIKMGNVYTVIIKSASDKEIKVFIRETSKGKECKNIISFPGEKINYVSFTPPELVHKKADLTQEEATI